MKKHLYPTLLLLTLATACAGVRRTGDTFTAHAESFHFLGLGFPCDDHDRAWNEVPEDAEVISSHSTPLDWSSVVGVLHNLFGISETEISWKAK